MRWPFVAIGCSWPPLSSCCEELERIIGDEGVPIHAIRAATPTARPTIPAVAALSWVRRSAAPLPPTASATPWAAPPTAEVATPRPEVICDPTDEAPLILWWVEGL